MDEPAEPLPSETRRDFLSWLLGLTSTTLFGAILYPVLRYISPPEVPEAATNQVEAGRTNDPDLLEKGFKIVRFGAEPVILVKVSDQEYRAFAATCTHLDCIVEFRAKEQMIWCNCHNGQYDLNGRNVAGPPPRPLDRFDVHLVAGGAGQPATLVVSKA